VARGSKADRRIYTQYYKFGGVCGGNVASRWEGVYIERIRSALGPYTQKYTYEGVRAGASFYSALQSRWDTPLGAVIRAGYEASIYAVLQADWEESIYIQYYRHIWRRLYMQYYRQIGRRLYTQPCRQTGRCHIIQYYR
jgi:hypothetical protein